MKQFISDREPDKTGTLTLHGKAYTYLIKVRRLKIGNTVPVLLPETGSTEMLITEINHAAQTFILKKLQSSAIHNTLSSFSPSANLILLQWLVKGNKIDTIIRQATESGVRMIIPVVGEFSVAKKHNPAQMERFRRIIREARQQSGSLINTEVSEPVPLAQALNQLVRCIPTPLTSAALGICTETPEYDITVHNFLSTHPAYIVLAVGAEGGISPSETALLRTAGFQHIHFKTNVLRAETAALYAIAAVQTIINEAYTWQLHE